MNILSTSLNFFKHMLKIGKYFWRMLSIKYKISKIG